MFRDMGQLAPHQEEPLQRVTTTYLRDALARGEYLAWIAEDTGTPVAAVGGAGVQLRPILPRREVTDSLQAQSPQSVPLVLLATNSAPHLTNLKLRHHELTASRAFSKAAGAKYYRSLLSHV